MTMHDDDRAFFLNLFERLENRIEKIEERLPAKRSGKTWWKVVGVAALSAFCGALATRAANHVGYIEAPPPPPPSPTRVVQQ